MSAVSKWVVQVPFLTKLPQTKLWRVHQAAYGALSYNPNSKARLALPDSHAMLYVASSFAGALWETRLRYASITASREVKFPASLLRGWHATPIQLLDERPLLELHAPGVRSMIPNGDSDEQQRLTKVLTTPDHASTHPVAVELWDELKAANVIQMPALSWASRQFSQSIVYLDYLPVDAYKRPSQAQPRWEVAGESIDLDSDQGYARIRRELEALGLHWNPISPGAPTE